MLKVIITYFTMVAAFMYASALFIRHAMQDKMFADAVTSGDFSGFVWKKKARIALMVDEFRDTDEYKSVMKLIEQPEDHKS